SSSNNSIATVSTGGLVCGGKWDSTFINCNATLGPGGVGQVTITATATASGVTATVTVYVHEEVDQVQAVLGSSCTTMGQPVNISGKAFSTTAPGCSPAAPCDITSTVGPFTFGSNNSSIVANSAGIESTFSASTNSPTYTSGGTIRGSTGQTCNLSSFNGVNGAMATVALTGSNTIASGTHLTITSPGSGATVPPTTAALSNGTATCSGTANVITALTNGVLTAATPGATTVFASVSGVNSVGTAYLTCPVASIKVRDANSSNISFTLNPQGTQPLTADVYDTNGQYITPTLMWGSSSTAAATVAATGSVSNPGTVTAANGGTAYITASCGFPACNLFVPTQYSQNVVTINVTHPAATTVYAASTNSKSLVPINTSSNTAGTAITLPNPPNSIVASPSGATVYLGSSSGLMAVTVSSGNISTAPVNGTIVAISADGNFMLISDTVGSNIYYVNLATGAILSTVPAVTTNSSAYTPDSRFNEWLSGTSLGYGFATNLSAILTLPYTGNAVDIIAEGGLYYVSSASSHEVDVRSTCNQAEDQVLAANAPTLIRALPNGTGAVAADSPNIDVISTPPPLSAGCPVATQSTLNSYDLGAGSFTAQQMLVSSDATRVWIVSNLPELLSFSVPTLAPATVPLAGMAMAFNGGITLDGSRVYVGTSDNTVHEIDTAALSDAAQIPVNLTDTNGNLTAPNLVAVVP
ncbi:MAG TPA: hypothetical protein VL240_04765, partial [Candidatus Binatia bacterium]|nr:hypothetical protein [Candidatus Binatia bacterium]